MVQKQTGQKVYKTMQGKSVNMDMLRKRNELTPAVGNVSVNARGDELGPGGQIIRKREEIVKEYYDKNTGRYYYYNAKNGTTQWEKPMGVEFKMCH